MNFQFFHYIFKKIEVELCCYPWFKPKDLKEGGKQALITEWVLIQFSLR